MIISKYNINTYSIEKAIYTHEPDSDINEYLNEKLNKVIKEKDISRNDIISIQEFREDGKRILVMRYWENPNAKIEAEQRMKEHEENFSLMINWTK